MQRKRTATSSSTQQPPAKKSRKNSDGPIERVENPASLPTTHAGICKLLNLNLETLQTLKKNSLSPDINSRVKNLITQNKAVLTAAEQNRAEYKENEAHIRSLEQQLQQHKTTIAEPRYNLRRC